VFAPITGFLLGHQGKCSSSVLGGNGCRSHLDLTEACDGKLFEIVVAEVEPSGARVLFLQQAAFPKHPWRVPSNQCWNEGSLVGFLVDGSSLRKLKNEGKV
jgi:hypothetical protein